MTRKSLVVVATVGLVTLLCGASPASAQAVAPSLGTAAPYTVLGTNAIPTVGTVTCTNTGPGTAINGNVGTTFTSITNTGCTITGSIDAPVAGSVVTDFNAAFAAVDTLNPVCTGVIPTVTTTLAPGVYCSAAGTTIGAGVILTLNGTASDVWVFRVGTGGPGALTLTSAQVVMGGTALACNVFWKTSAAATLTDSTFNGTVLSGAAVTMTRGSWFGRALATTDATVTDAAPLTFAGCAPVRPPTVAKAFSPASITVGGVSRLTITLNNPNAAAIALTAAFTDTLPGGVLVAAAPNPTTTCGGAVTATAGGSTVTLATGSTIPAGSCTIGGQRDRGGRGLVYQHDSRRRLADQHRKQRRSGHRDPDGQPARLRDVAHDYHDAESACPVSGSVAVGFTISGAVIPDALVVTATSSNPTLVPQSAMVITKGIGGARVLTINGADGRSGVATITVTVTDPTAGNCATSTTFQLTVGTAVPTLPEWALLILALLLAAAGVVVLRKRENA